MWLVSLVGWILSITIVFAVIGIPMITYRRPRLDRPGHRRRAVKTANGEAFTYRLAGVRLS